MFKGGYKLIDLKDNAFTVDSQTAVTIPGIYDAIESNYRKPLIFTGVKIGDAENFDAFVNMSVGTDSVYHGIIDLNADGTPLIITVNDEDGVFISTYTAPEDDSVEG